MTQIAELKREVTTRQRNGVAATVAVVLLLVVGGVFASTQWLGSDDVSAPATDSKPTRTEQAQDVAADFFAAHAAFDADGMLALLEPAAVAIEWGTEADVRSDAAWRAAVGWTELHSDSCTSNGVTGGTVYLRCDYAVHSLGSQRLDRGPFGDAYWALHVADGKITYARSEFPYSTNGFAAEMWEPLEAFIKQNYPADHARMYREDGDDAGVQDTAILSLWRAHIQAYGDAETAG